MRQRDVGGEAAVRALGTKESAPSIQRLRGKMHFLCRMYIFLSISLPGMGIMIIPL